MLRNGRVGVGWGMLTFLARCTLQLLTIYMILRMLVMMLKMMMLWWWWCDDDDDDGDDDDDVMMIMMMMMFIMMMTVQTKQVVFWNDDAFSHAGCAKSLFRYSGVLIFYSNHGHFYHGREMVVNPVVRLAVYLYPFIPTSTFQILEKYRCFRNLTYIAWFYPKHLDTTLVFDFRTLIAWFWAWWDKAKKCLQRIKRLGRKPAKPNKKTRKKNTKKKRKKTQKPANPEISLFKVVFVFFCCSKNHPGLCTRP